jgi:hypothetical protein
MAIDTINKKLALLSFGQVFQPNLPMSPSTLGQDDRQQLLWGYPGILWSAGAALAFVFDLNTRLAVYLRDFYSAPTGDLSTLIVRYLATLSGEYTARFQRLITDATEAMT